MGRTGCCLMPIKGVTVEEVVVGRWGVGGGSMAMAVKSVIFEPERWENAPKTHS